MGLGGKNEEKRKKGEGKGKREKGRGKEREKGKFSLQGGLSPPCTPPPQQTSSKFARASETCQIHLFLSHGLGEKI